MVNALAIRAFAFLLLASLLVFGGCRWQAGHDAKRIAAAESETAQLRYAIKSLDDRTRLAEAAADAASKTLEESQRDADRKQADADKAAKRAAADLAAALRSGKQRLSDTWACPAPAGNGEARSDAGQAATARQSDSAARIVAAADADAVTINWLYDRWQAEHRAVIQSGCAVER